MKAILLAAGLGTRLRPITDRIPKCLVPIKGRPLLEYWFDLLFFNGIERVLVNTHYLSSMVEEYVKNCRWSKQIDLVHEGTILGTGGTVLANSDWISDKPVLIAHADNLTIFNVRQFLDRHLRRPSTCAITMMTFDTDSPETCGIIEETNNIVVAFHEKVVNPPGIRANAAVYIFEPEVIKYMATLNRKVIDLSTEVLPRYVGRISTYYNELYHRDIGNQQSLKLAETEFPVN